MKKTMFFLVFALILSLFKGISLGGYLDQEYNDMDADENGYVTMPNVNIPQEMMNLTIASRAYQANTAVLKRYQAMVETTLELLK